MIDHWLWRIWMDRIKKERVLQPGDYVPHSLVYPPWGDGTYRVFKLARVASIVEDKTVDNKEVKFTEQVKDYPEGDHDDQVDTTRAIRPGTRFTLFFNIVMIILETLSVLAILAMPLGIGIVAWEVLPGNFENLKDSAWIYLFYYIVGLPLLAAWIIGAVGIYALGGAFVTSIRTSIGLIRDRSK